MLELAVITSRTAEVVLLVVDGRLVIVPPLASAPPIEPSPAAA